ncbi:hypothetical protein [Neisseria gonorrhoeae]|uniref:hypothetical protein n=1 Tax=Neisseria gonorrhoeae TaxID=485 RepID=UPI0010C58DB7|nr:hypothetical protein [Neisseria gonorrhoeae]QBK51528.1 phage associated protein [Neisseria gonorrhoeae]
MLNAYDVADFFLSPFEEEDGSKSPISNFKNSCITHKATPLPYLTAPVCRKYRTLAARSVVPAFTAPTKNTAAAIACGHIERQICGRRVVVLNRVRKEQGCYTAWHYAIKPSGSAVDTDRQGEVIGIALMGNISAMRCRRRITISILKNSKQPLKTALSASRISTAPTTWKNGWSSKCSAAWRRLQRALKNYPKKTAENCGIYRTRPTERLIRLPAGTNPRQRTGRRSSMAGKVRFANAQPWHYHIAFQIQRRQAWRFDIRLHPSLYPLRRLYQNHRF